VHLTLAATSPRIRGRVDVVSDMQCNPAIFLLLAQNSAGQTKKSITYAVTCKPHQLFEKSDG